MSLGTESEVILRFRAGIPTLMLGAAPGGIMWF